MKIFLECLPCMLRQVLESAQLATDNETTHEHIMNDAMTVLANYNDYSCPPELCEAMHTITMKHSGVLDPYAEIKSHDITESLKLEPLLKDFVSNGNNPLLKKIKVSATGNVMDSALYSNLDIKSCFAEELERTFAICDIKAFENALNNASSILVIGDNAGEVVFDKLLVEHLSQNHRVIYAVRDAPIINDATIDDAVKTNIDNYCELISTGCKMPGAVLDSCSAEFRKLFDDADVIISKGQGNFEALSEIKRDIFFLLKAKCDIVAKRLNVNKNEYVFKKN